MDFHRPFTEEKTYRRKTDEKVLSHTCSATVTRAMQIKKDERSFSIHSIGKRNLILVQTRWLKFLSPCSSVLSTTITFGTHAKNKQTQNTTVKGREESRNRGKM